MKEKYQKMILILCQIELNKLKKDLGQMKSNVNALYGAIQQVDRLLTKLNDGNKEMPAEKEAALNIATS